MKRINAFISYSSKQKTIGANFKHCISNYCGYNTFLAHDDIPVASVWEDEIIEAIMKTDFFIPLLSDEFKNSDFTDQEIGIAIAFKKKIIPIKLGKINPYGFINKYQALQYKLNPSPYLTNNIKQLTISIAQVGLSYEDTTLHPYHQLALNSIIFALCESFSFDTTNTIIEIITKCQDLSSSHLEQITYATKTNPQVSEAFGLNKLKKFLLKTYNYRID